MREKKTPWPTKAVMQQIYNEHFWGGETFDFYSGKGSHDQKIIAPYLKSVTAFLKAHHNTLTVCDLGCGDFNIGKNLFKYAKTYIAVDIVENLIERNKITYKADNLKFSCLDISKDELPKADCAILRQVLQHLSNAEIQEIILKLGQYKYVILTEHLPVEDFIPNKDKITNLGIRLKHNSGVDVLTDPFNLKVQNSEMINEVILEDSKGKIVSTLLTL